MTYDFANLHPLLISIDADGDTHAVYDLPSPVRWEFRHFYHDEAATFEKEHFISRVRVCVSTSNDCPYYQPATIIVPIDEHGEESAVNSLCVHGVASVMAAFKRLGFSPALRVN